MKELSSKARSMLDALQTVDSPAAGIETRAWGAVMARTAAGDLGPAIPADAPASATAAGGLGKTLALVVGAVAVATAIGVGLASEDEPTEVAPTIGVRAIEPATDAPAPPERSDEEPALVPALPEPEPAPEPAPEAAIAPSPEPAPIRPARTRAKSEARPIAPPPSTPAADGPDALEREMRLMSEARAALGAGDAARAIGLLKDHAKQFPKGAFVLEREVSWITALCALGETEAARARADGFLRKHGGHPLAKKVRASCGGTAP